MTRSIFLFCFFLTFPFFGKAQLQQDTLYSLQQLNQFLADAKNNSDAWRLAETHAHFGDYYFFKADYEQAFKSYRKSMDRYASLGDSVKLYDVRMTLASMYIFQNMEQSGERMLRQAIQFYEREKHRPELAKAYLELSRILRSRQDYKNEIYYLNKSVDINRNLQDTTLDIVINLEKANSYLNLKELNKSLGNAESALRLSETIQNTTLTSRCLLVLGNVYKEKNKPEIALDYLQRSYDLTAIDNAIHFRDVYKSLAETYALAEVHDTAYQYLTKYTILNDSLFNADQIEAANRLSIKYDSEQKDELISELSEERRSAESNAQKQRNLLISALIGFLAVLGGIYFIIRFFQKQIATRELISKQNEEINRQKITELENNMKIESMHAMLEGQEAERERVAKDLHDSLGGLLSTVKLQFDSLENKIKGIQDINNYKNANRLLDTACQEVRDIARNMQPSALLNLGLVAAVKDLIIRIEDPDSRSIDFQHYGMDKKLENSIALTVYRLVQELLNNSIKHSKAKEILVQLTREENELIIMVEDDGIGFDVDGVKKGMGTENIMSRVNFLKGDLSVHSEKGKGTTTLITVAV